MVRRTWKFLGLDGGRPSPWLYLFLVTAMLSMGCNMSTLYFILPWKDTIPPKFELSTSKKEVTVVIQSSFAHSLEAHPELLGDFQTADRDLCERVGQALRKRYDDNRERIKIIPYYQVKSFVNKQGDSRLVSVYEVGSHFKADYVVNLEINSMSFYENGYRQLFRGKADMSVTVFDMSKPQGEGPVFEEVYRTEYPASGPVDAGGSSVLQFRSMFLGRVSKDLSRWFAASPHDERFDFD